MGTDSARGDDIPARRFWNRHASPWSVWWFVVYPVLILALYRRDRRLAAGALRSIGANLWLVPPPKTDEAWTTRVVRGEQLWLEHGLGSSMPGLLLTAIGGVVNLYAIRATLRRRPVGTVAAPRCHSC